MTGTLKSAALIGALIAATSFESLPDFPTFSVPSSEPLRKGGKTEKSKRHTGQAKIRRAAKRRKAIK